MRIVKIGVVDLMIWWKGIDTIASDTFDIAMLMVNRNENKINVICSLEFNLLNAKSPRSKRT
jgi:hypothetical protein